jgi:hypothetical protein
MRKILTVILFLTITLSAQSYKKISINLTSVEQAKELAALGIVDGHPVFNKDKTSIEVFVSSSQIKLLNENGFSYNIIISDWKKYYEALPKMSESEKEAALSKSYMKYGVKGFDYGSMGGFLTADEVYAKLDEMHANYPNLITAKDTLGVTFLGNPMYYVKISDNPDVDEDEPEVFYNSLIHAREPEAMMQMIYFMYYLLENYGTDPEVTYLVNNRQLYFLPVFNVDGYKYNQQTDPNGGGMWRKNRRTNNNGTHGVDLNRNWGYEWGYDDNGSSGSPSSETYRGTAPFSEPATQAVRQFCDAHHFVLAMNFHTYSDLVILPWGYIPEETPDSLLFREYASEMTQYNGYTWGISSDIIYAVNGASDDWMYGEQIEKNKIISMTTEVGTSADGFWPPQSRILPLAEENVFPNLYLAWAAGGFVSIADIGFSSEFVNPGETTKIGFNIRNKGLGAATGVSVSVTPLSGFVNVSGRAVSIDTLAARTNYTLPDSMIITVSPEAPVGVSQQLVAAISMSGQTVYFDTLSFVVGTPSVLWEDTSNVIEDNWTVQSTSSQKWDETTSSFVTPPNSYTDSKTGDYNDNITNKIISKNNIDLTGSHGAFLSFYTKWDIENNWDAGRVRISTNNGTSWNNLTGTYTNPGSGQGEQIPAGIPVYDGVQSQWVHEKIDLSDYDGMQIKLQFMLQSDGYVTGDGWYIDDIKIMYYDSVQVSVDDNFSPYKFHLAQNYPNPFNPTTTINYSVAETGHVTLSVFNALGQKITTLVNKEQARGNYSVRFNAASREVELPSGIYFYKLECGNFSATKKMLLLK